MFMINQGKKLLFSIVVAFVMVFMCSCSTENAYKINVSSSLDILSGKDIELRIYDGENAVSETLNTTIKRGQATFKGEIATPALGQLYVELERIPYILPVVVEKGNIYAKLDSTTVLYGTEHNNQLHQFFLDKDDFLNTCSEIDSIPELKRALRGFYADKLVEHEENDVLSKYIQLQLKNL